MPKTVSYAKWSLEPYCIGMKLRLLRTQKRLTLARLAAETGLSTALLSKLETDRMVPTLPTLATISRVYGVGMSYFFAEPAKHTLSITRKATLQQQPRAGIGEDNPAEHGGGWNPAGGAGDRVSRRRSIVCHGCRPRGQRPGVRAGGEVAVGCGRHARTAGGRRLRLPGKRDGAGLERGRKAPLPDSGGDTGG